MGAEIIDGKAFAARLRARLGGLVRELKADHGVKPGLAVVLVGHDPASEVYVRSKAHQTVETGMHSEEHRLDAATPEADLLVLIERLNRDPAIHGILVQLPLPGHIDEARVINTVAPEKDVEGFHVANIGRLATGPKAMVPCTPLDCLMLLRDRLVDLAGLDALVIGRSNIVGKPMAQLLLHHSSVMCARMKPGATVIDVGINRVAGPEGKAMIIGDVDFAGAVEVAGAVTPVPGGVGPMTIACLLANTMTACCRINDLPDPEGLTP